MIDYLISGLLTIMKTYVMRRGLVSIYVKCLQVMNELQKMAVVAAAVVKMGPQLADRLIRVSNNSHCVSSTGCQWLDVFLNLNTFFTIKAYFHLLRNLAQPCLNRLLR